MAKPVARTTDPISPHAPCPPGKCGMGSENVIIENKLAYRVGDSTFPHGKPAPFAGCVPHTSVLTNGSSKVFVNNRPLGRVGDAHACGTKIVSGASKVFVGG
jgi:uncharacterized Zn-binding protein involved in type VI secretion